MRSLCRTCPAWWTLWVALATFASGCAVTEGVPTSVPDMDGIANTARLLSYDHERTACVGCPERWEPLACTFDEELLRHESGLNAARCVIAGPMLGHREPPPALLIHATRRIQAATPSLAKGAPAEDLALQLYAFGADLQRLGSLEAWDLGASAREQALDALDRARPSRGWPAELLAMEASAPSPARLLGIAILDTVNSHKELDWRGRAGVERAASLTVPLIRASSESRGALLQEAETALEPARLGLPPARLALRLEKAEAHRKRAQEIARNAMPASPERKRAPIP